jgi:hypothetical protein
MEWDVEYTDEFEAWWDHLSEAERDSVQATVMLLGEDGPQRNTCHWPNASTTSTWKH